MSCGVGGVGVRTAARVFGICVEGGGVMEEVVRGAGDVNLTRSGDAAFDMLTGAVGVSGRTASVVGIKSCGGWYNGAWESILPEAQLA